MRQGPGMPFGGMGSGMMRPVHMRQMPGQFGGMPMRAMGHAPYQRNPMLGMGRPVRQGGILARLLGKGKGTTGLHHFGSAAGGAGRAAGGGVLQSLASPGSLHSFLNNTQQVLKTAQSVGPMVQQYGPLVKNLPAMWKLYRGLKDLPDQEEGNGADAQGNTVEQPKPETPEKRKADAKAAVESMPAKKIRKATAKPGKSTPKLYI